MVRAQVQRVQKGPLLLRIEGLRMGRRRRRRTALFTHVDATLIDFRFGLGEVTVGVAMGPYSLSILQKVSDILRTYNSYGAD